MQPLPSGRSVTFSALDRLLSDGRSADALAFVELFGRELDRYASVIVGPDLAPAGFLTRGEDRSFTARAVGALAQLGMTEQSLTHYQALASWFEHLRGFLKFEWHRSENGLQPLAACYYRRRPSLETTLDRLDSFGVASDVRAKIRDIAGIVNKQTLHFVAAAFRPDLPLHHKLYFSQWVTPDTRAQVKAGIAQLFDLFACPESAKQHWLVHHERMLSAGEQTIFVSIRFSADEMMASFKLDYPHVTIADASTWLPEPEQGPSVADATAVCDLTGTRRLSYLGVRFVAEREHPALKYYCDVPRAQPA